MYRRSGSLKPWLKVFETEDKLHVLKLTAELERRWCLGYLLIHSNSPKLIMFMFLVELFLFQRIVVKRNVVFLYQIFGSLSNWRAAALYLFWFLFSVCFLVVFCFRRLGTPVEIMLHIVIPFHHLYAYNYNPRNVTHFFFWNLSAEFYEKFAISALFKIVQK
jgi:hypothetical protein